MDFFLCEAPNQSALSEFNRLCGDETLCFWRFHVKINGFWLQTNFIYCSRHKMTIDCTFKIDCNVCFETLVNINELYINLQFNFRYNCAAWLSSHHCFILNLVKLLILCIITTSLTEWLSNVPAVRLNEQQISLVICLLQNEPGSDLIKQNWWRLLPFSCIEILTTQTSAVVWLMLSTAEPK